MENSLSEPLERLFAQIATPPAVRAVEEGAGADGMWRDIEASGYLDALLPAVAGGAGLNLTEVFPLLLAAGRHPLPVPFAHTLVARALLDAAGVAVPAGPIAVAGSGAIRAADGSEALGVGFAKTARWVLVDFGDAVALLPVAGAAIETVGGPRSLGATLRWGGRPDGTIELPAGTGATDRLREVEAAVYAALIAGAAERVLSMTLEHARQRTQFGRPIGRFQAVQQQISVMAERTAAARMAAQLACSSADWRPRPLVAALGKCCCSEVAPLIADTAHAVHGAMGITDEYDLQLYTRRLRAWRLCAGSESYWAAQLGAALLGQPRGSALSFICGELATEHR